MNSRFTTGQFAPVALLLAVAVLITTGCSSESEPVTSAKTKYEVADNESRSPADDRQSAPGPGLAPAQGPGAAGAGRSPGGAPQQSRPPQQGAPAGTLPGQPSMPAKPPTQPPQSLADQPKSDSPEDLLKFIQEIRSREPSGVTREEVAADFERNQEKIIETADKLLESDADIGSKVTAGEAKLSSLGALEQLGMDGAGQRFVSFSESLRESSDSELANLGRRAGLARALDSLARGNTEDTQEIMEDFEALLNTADKDQRLVMLSSQLASVLENAGHNKESMEVLKLAADALEGIEDPELAESANALMEQGQLAKLGVREKFRALMEGAPDSIGPFMDAADKLLSNENLGATTLSILLQQAAPAMEGTHPEAAGELYEMIEQAYGDHPNQEFADLVKRSVETYRTRASLVGQSLNLQEVTTVDGEPFDWSQYQGKVVLVDFWATWCRPCLEEFPNLKENYNQYKDQGFEIVGVNVDHDPEALEQFFSYQQLPWTNVVSADPENRGVQEMPLARQLGVDFLPFVVLVGRDGKIAAVNVRGEKLAPKLSELLGDSGAGEPAGQNPG